MVVVVRNRTSITSVAGEELDCSTDSTILFDLVVDNETLKAVDRCKEYPAEASKWVIRRDGHKSISWRRLALHEACVRKQNSILIEALLEAYPDGATQQDHNGRLPLHHACFYGASREVVRKLLLAYPESIDVRDIWGKTPLGVAQGSTYNRKQEIIDALSKGPSHYLLQKEEEKWTETAEKKIEENEKKYQEELLAMKSRCNDVEGQLQSDRLKFKETEEELSKELKDVRDKLQAANSEATRLVEIETMYEKALADLDDEKRGTSGTLEDWEKKHADVCEELDDAKATNAKLMSELESVKSYEHNIEAQLGAMASIKEELQLQNAALSARLTKSEENEASLEKELEAMTSSKEQLVGENKTLSARVTESEENVSKLKDELNELKADMETRTRDLSSISGKEKSLRDEFSDLEKKLVGAVKENLNLRDEVKDLRKQVASDEDLQGKVSKLEEEYSEARNKYEAGEKSYLKQNGLLDAEAKSLRAQVEKLNQEVKELEKKTEEDAETIASIGKSAADAYLHSTECISQFETKLADANAKAKAATDSYQEERTKLTAKIASLEDTVRTLVAKRAKEQQETIESFDELEKALNQAAEERSRMMQTLSLQKKSMIREPAKGGISRRFDR